MPMNFSRRHLARFLCLNLALCVLAAWPSAAQRFHIRPHLQNVTQDGATLIWETPDPCVGEVEYGRPGALENKAKESAPSEIHRVRMTGLQAGTEYGYRVRAGNEEATATFRTAPAGIRPTTFVAVGDSRRWNGHWERSKMSDHCLQWKPEFFMNNGDLVLRGHEYNLWPEHFQRFADINGSYMMVTARGNHEGSMYSDRDNDWFAKYHELPDEGEPRLSFDWGNIHMVLLSYEDVGSPARIAATAEWLDRDLSEAGKDRWNIVVQHFPIYCAGYDGPEDSRKEVGKTLAPLARVMERHGVRVNMAGHTHIYERSYPWREDKRDDAAGVVYVVNGGDINANYPEPWTAVRDDKRTQSKPTYSVFQCLDDRIDIRTFAWSTVENAIVEIDHAIVPKSEDVAKAAVAALAGKRGAELARAVEEVGAMMYGPGASAVAPALKDSDAAVRRAAASALRSIGTEEAAEALAACLDDEDAAVRREAARALEIALPEGRVEEAARRAVDSAEDEDVRVALLGALQRHAPARAAKKAAFKVLASDAPEAVRRRAAYALGAIAEKGDARKLAKLVRNETDEYVLIRLGYTLNNVTGNKVPLGDKSPFANSRPGTRGEFVKTWLKRR